MRPRVFLPSWTMIGKKENNIKIGPAGKSILGWADFLFVFRKLG